MFNPYINGYLGSGSNLLIACFEFVCPYRIVRWIFKYHLGRGLNNLLGILKLLCGIL